MKRRVPLLAVALYFIVLTGFAFSQPPPPAPYSQYPYYYQPARPAVVWVPSYQTGPLGIFWWRTWTPYPQPLPQPAPYQQAPQQ